jgi:hypothetical protein
MHAPVQAMSQHTPSAQNPEPHSFAASQLSPFVFFTRQVSADVAQ